MVEATDFAKQHDPAGSWPFDGPPVGRVLVEREMRSGAVIVREVHGQDATQVAFAQNDDMIEALTPDRTDEPFHERILPSFAPACSGSFESETWRVHVVWKERRGPDSHTPLTHWSMRAPSQVWVRVGHR